MDPYLIATQLTLGTLGILGVATATPENWFDHALRVAFALCLTALASKVPPQRILKVSTPIFLFALGMLVLVLFFGVSPEGSEANRWLDLKVFVVQPSEIMKIAVIAYLATFFYNHAGRVKAWKPMLMVGLTVALIAVEPNVSTALFIFLLSLSIMVAAGTPLGELIRLNGMALLVALIIGVPYLSQYSYLEQRISAYLAHDTTAELSQNEGYQAAQAQRYLEEGGVTGLSTGDALYLPARETDMIAVTIGHALGLIGTLTLVGLYLIVALRGVKIASNLTGPGGLLAIGATTYICGQAALNLLVASGLFPITGVPLPFVSYGFNSLLSIALAFGFLHSAHRELRSQQPDSPEVRHLIVAPEAHA